MLVVGIDPGTRCGWAVVSDGKVVASGAWDLAPRRHEGGGMRFVRLRRYLNELFDSSPAGVALGYEEVRAHLGTDAAHIYGGIISHISEVCESRRIPYIGIPVGTVKKLATGKGNAKKDAMLAAARRLVPGVEDDNEADAIFIALATEQEIA